MNPDYRMELLSKFRNKPSLTSQEFISLGLSIYKDEESIYRAGRYMVSVGLLKSFRGTYTITERGIEKIAEIIVPEEEKIIVKMNPCGARMLKCVHFDSCYLSFKCTASRA